MHWAIKYLGKPYVLGADGPYAYDCWGLARAIFKERLGLDMPAVDVRSHNNGGAMKEIASGFGWGPVVDAPREGDAVLMRSPIGRHIAVAIESSRGISFIHADGVCGVEIIQSLPDFAQRSYKNIEVWRHDTRTRG
ncbi:MAG: cell wall-associated hydrolase [Caudoviricetes sp.]|nr:MAG: cell wall-associated hydrolase [Caudoviricetes sp.]